MTTSQSTSQSVFLWKQKAEIDYTPPFISLWFALNAWMRERFNSNPPTDRGRLEVMKRGGHTLSETFSGLIQSEDANGNRFRGNLGELQRSLVNAGISYERNYDMKVSFANCVIDWNNGQITYENLMKLGTEQNKLEIGVGLWVEDDAERLFAAYMEIVYQVRCALFHGELAPTPENERVIRQIYLTLSMVMERI